MMIKHKSLTWGSYYIIYNYYKQWLSLNYSGYYNILVVSRCNNKCLNILKGLPYKHCYFLLSFLNNFSLIYGVSDILADCFWDGNKPRTCILQGKLLCSYYYLFMFYIS